jgi:cation diffusion facilitator family transporter
MADKRPPLSDQQRIALTSVAAAAFLVLLKLAAGLASGSLGLIAESAHSGTDLVAALLTFWALRVAARPPDRDHPYGHGKAEHLAALGEAGFLVFVSLVIAYQAVIRLTAPSSHEVNAAWYTLVVVGVVLVVDISRTTLSWRAARRLHSAALASNALHFASDFAGTIAVLIGLLLARAGYQSGDAGAGLVVAVLVVAAAVGLMRANVRVLMDESPEGVESTARQAIAHAEPQATVRRLRTRHAGGKNFIDLTLGVAPDAAVGQGYAIADSVESAIRQALPDSDISVRVEPRSGEDLRERATGAALSVRRVREVHNVRIVELDGRNQLSLHLKLPAAISLHDAHEVADAIETAVRLEVPEIDTVHVHLEPLSPPSTAEPATLEERELHLPPISQLAEEVSGRRPSQLQLYREPRGLVAYLTVRLAGDQTLAEAHRAAGRLEEAIRAQSPDLAEVVVHTEPVSSQN